METQAKEIRLKAEDVFDSKKWKDRVKNIIEVNPANSVNGEKFGFKTVETLHSKVSSHL